MLVCACFSQQSIIIRLRKKYNLKLDFKSPYICYFILFYKSKNVKRAAFISILISNNIPSVCILSMKTAQLENTSDHQNLYDSQTYASLAIRTGLSEW